MANLILAILLLVGVAGMAFAVIFWGVLLNWLNERAKLRSPAPGKTRVLSFALIFATAILAVMAWTNEGKVWDYAGTLCSLAWLATWLEIKRSSSGPGSKAVNEG